MAVRPHRDQVALLAVGRVGDLARRFAAREDGFDGESVLRQPRHDVVEVRAVLAHLLRFAELEGIEVARGESVGDVDEHQRRAARARELADVADDRLVRLRVLQRHEDPLVHQASHPVKVCRRSHGRSRMSRKPSITIWPASVPVSVEFWPLARSARANTVLAPVTPRSGVRSWYASWISATSPCPVRLNVAAATIRIAALMNSA